MRRVKGQCYRVKVINLSPHDCHGYAATHNRGAIVGSTIDADAAPLLLSNMATASVKTSRSGMAVKTYNCD
jgi:hypothetical protein